MADKHKITLFCKKCGGDAFKMRWEYESDRELFQLTLCHDGYGFIAEDSIITCAKCGSEARWDEDDFTETRGHD